MLHIARHKFATACLLAGLATLTLTQQACAPVVVAGAATGAIVASDRRTAGTILDDKGIELKIRNRVAQDKALAEKLHVNAAAFNKTVLLTGEVPSEELRDQVIAWAGAVDGVKQVYNALDLAKPTEYKSRNFDSWLASKVRGRLAGKAEFDASHIKVVTENAVVYLMGMVKQSEGDAAAAVASEVEGAKRVVKVFEYLD
jgi:osmotically-inducible protein OsmY